MKAILELNDGCKYFRKKCRLEFVPITGMDFDVHLCLNEVHVTGICYDLQRKTLLVAKFNEEKEIYLIIDGWRQVDGERMA